MKKDIIINIFFSSLSALLLILSSAGFGLSPLVFIAFIPIFYAIKKGGLHPFLSGWIMGFLYWLIGLSWMTITFSYYGGAPLFAAIALLIFAAVISGLLFFAPFAYVARKYDNPLLLGMAFIALEALKGTFFFGGVPWLNLAQSQYKNIIILQFVSWFGELGLSFIIVIINVLLFKLIFSENRKKYAVLLICSVFFMIVPGLVKTVFPAKYEIYKDIKIIQPGYKQEMKWSNDKRVPIIIDLNNKVANSENNKYDLLVLPETAYPAPILDIPAIMEVLYKKAENVPILTGTDRTVHKDDNSHTYNSMVLIDEEKSLRIYDKRHLTPFGEYFPFENLLEPIKEYFFGPGEMLTAGDKAVVLKTGDMKIAPLICFESGFSNLLKEPISEGANLIAVISNDTWFGKNQGRMQHLAVNAMRAAEYGKSAVIATQDGISAYIMPDGSIPLSVTEQIPAEISYKVPLSETRTIYSYINYSWIFVVIAIAYYMIKRKKVINKEKES